MAELTKRQEKIQAAREVSEILSQKTYQEREARELLGQRFLEILDTYLCVKGAVLSRLVEIVRNQM